MKKYKVEFHQTETFIVDVKAKDEKKAINLAKKIWDTRADKDYFNTGDTTLEVGAVYDVSNTDDPFYPEN